MAIKFTQQNFRTEVLDSDMLVLVDFYADWCGPCKVMAPIIEELAQEYDGVVKIGKLDTEEAPDISGQYKVMSIPTFILFKNGEILDTMMGITPKEDLQEKIDAYK